MLCHLAEKTVLVTGGTKGIGRATVESFVKAGATVYGTYFWGDNLNALEKDFSSYAKPPTFIRADSRDSHATAQLIAQIAQERSGIDIVILNAAFAPRFHDHYQYRSLLDSIEHNTWPLVTYLDCIKQTFGHYPRYLVAITSEGHRSCHIAGYDYVAAAKAMLETLVKYIGAREEIIMNCISPGVVDTEAFTLVFGEKAQALIRQYDPDLIVPAEAIGNVSVALCSGLMDAVRGQVIMVDNGKLFTDNFARWLTLLGDTVVAKS